MKTFIFYVIPLMVIAGILGQVAYNYTNSYTASVLIGLLLAIIWPQPRRY